MRRPVVKRHIRRFLSAVETRHRYGYDPKDSAEGRFSVWEREWFREEGRNTSLSEVEQSRKLN